MLSLRVIDYVTALLCDVSDKVSMTLQGATTVICGRDLSYKTWIVRSIRKKSGLSMDHNVNKSWNTRRVIHVINWYGNLLRYPNIWFENLQVNQLTYSPFIYNPDEVYLLWLSTAEQIFRTVCFQVYVIDNPIQSEIWKYAP